MLCPSQTNCNTLRGERGSHLYSHCDKGGKRGWSQVNWDAWWPSFCKRLFPFASAHTGARWVCWLSSYHLQLFHLATVLPLATPSHLELKTSLVQFYLEWLSGLLSWWRLVGCLYAGQSRRSEILTAPVQTLRQPSCVSALLWQRWTNLTPWVCSSNSNHCALLPVLTSLGSAPSVKACCLKSEVYLTALSQSSDL